MRWVSTPPCKKKQATETPTTSNLHQPLGEPETETAMSWMKSRDESRKEVSTPMESLAKPKQHLRIAAWNVRTMYETGKTAQVVNEMKRYQIDILGVSEMRWNDSGTLTLNSGEMVCYSGRSGGNHEQGVGLIMNKKSAKCLIGWEPVSSRIIRARFYSKYVKTSIIQCYAPTEPDEEEEKDRFYTQLQEEIDKTPRHDILIVMGDFNAKIGANNEGYEECMGKEGIGERNDNGERFCNMCHENGLVIGGSIFQHKRIHKETWISPDTRTRNQIDHIAISQQWRRSLQDVKAIRGADVNSNHHLLLQILKLELKKMYKKERNVLFDSQKLRDPGVKTRFTLELRNRFQLLEDIPAEESDSICNKTQRLFEESSE